MADHSAMKLGKAPRRHDHRTLMFARYLATALPPPPVAQDWTGKLSSLGMMMNDTLGDCTCAAAGHLEQLWTSEASAQVIPADDDILAAYEAITGYSPADPSTDQGAVELDVLNYWRTKGIAGRQISAYAAIDITQPDHVKQGIALFGGIYSGFQLPVSAQSQELWDVPAGGPVGDGAPGSWGGHAVPIVAYDATGLTCITWGALKRMTWAFFAGYCDEAYACLSPDWIEATGVDPAGVNLAALQTDLSQLAG